MTTVTIQRTEPGPEGEIPARGYLRFEPTKSRTSGSNVSLPLPFDEKLVDGEATVELEPTGPGWSWKVTYRLLGMVHRVKHYLVPDSPTPIADINLVAVEPESLEPEETPDPGWYSYVEQLVAGQVGVVRVVTGNEARLPMGAVFWIGGTTQPVNMAEDTDIWFKAAS